MFLRIQTLAHKPLISHPRNNTSVRPSGKIKKGAESPHISRYIEVVKPGVIRGMHNQDSAGARTGIERATHTHIQTRGHTGTHTLVAAACFVSRWPDDFKLQPVSRTISATTTRGGACRRYLYAGPEKKLSARFLTER